MRLPEPVTDADYYEDGKPNPAKVTLGRNLFYDKILSGNGNISCASCHHSLTDTGDGLSLPVGEGGRGIGVTRNTGSGEDAIHQRVPRNSPPLFNLGAREFRRMFHDGRVEVDPSDPSRLLTPAGEELPPGLESVLAAQAMFPVTSGTEMAGQAGENTIADAAVAGNLAGPGGVWEQLAQRLQGIPEYVDLFKEAYPDSVDEAGDITYIHAANAIAAYEAVAFRADNSPFDRYLRGDHQALSVSARQGMGVFYGKGQCDTCHSGKFQTDHEFYAIAMPQIGPGKGDGLDGRDDFGRERVTAAAEDRYRFRTPSLRNVALTGPWGHDGAYDTLESVVEHHLHPVDSLEQYDTNRAMLPYRSDLRELDFVIQSDPTRRAAIAAANEMPAVHLNQREVTYLVDFLHALTDPGSLDLRHNVPQRVPSESHMYE
jgi:cytochrome c peroxidase